MAKRQREEISETHIYQPEAVNITLDETADQTKATSANTLLKQIYFADNEKFYETAAARTSLFINTATEAGARAMFGDNIPEEYKDPHHTNRAKVQYAFIRVDTYFYNSIHEQYQLPGGQGHT